MEWYCELLRWLPAINISGARYFQRHSLRDSSIFHYGVDRIRVQVLVAFFLSTWPGNLYRVQTGFLTEPEMQAKIIL